MKKWGRGMNNCKNCEIQRHQYEVGVMDGKREQAKEIINFILKAAHPEVASLNILAEQIKKKFLEAGE